MALPLGDVHSAEVTALKPVGRRVHSAAAMKALLAKAPGKSAADLMRRIVGAGLGTLPLPGKGQTLDRWSALATVSAHDLVLAKFYEGHTDALAILAELHVDPRDIEGAIWAVWAADPPAARPQLKQAANGRSTVTGRKCWCSGAALVSHALMTVWEGDTGPTLVIVEMQQPGVEVTGEGWHAVGMAGSGSVDVLYDDAEVTVLGSPRAYLDRPGFWHGGAGIAACWYGGACGIAEALFTQALKRDDEFLAMHLGAVDVALSETAALLRSAATMIDERPFDDAMALALRCRASAERSAGVVIEHVGRALGATPYCRHPAFAQRVADLPVFIRQSHAERDLVALARQLVSSGQHAWSLTPP